MNIKKQLLIILFGLLGLSSLAQTNKKTLNYQAVILDPKAIDIPGASITGQPLNKGNVCLRFTLLNAQGGVDYEETQQVTTDEYGLVNVAIGNGTQASSNNTSIYKSFESIVWTSSIKSLKVSVSFDGCNSFKQVSTQAFNYTPYALYAEAVDYKNVREAPTKLSQFSNDVGYLIPKDLDPLKIDIKSNTSQIAMANQTIDDNKKSSDASFLIVNQNITSLDTKVAENTTAINTNTGSINTINSKLTDQQNQISDNRNQISSTNNNLNSQIGGLQGQINTTNSTVSNLSGAAEVVSSKSISITLGGANPSDQLYPSQKAAKAYVDNAIYDAVGTGVADATTLAPGKVQLSGDLAGTATSPTVPALANKENTSNKSTNVQTDGADNNKYPSVKAVKDYVDQATAGIALQAAVDAKADKNSPTFTGTPVMPSGTIAVTQTPGDNSTSIATTAFVQQATAAGIIDASSSTKGKIKLTGDLGGTADAPTVPGLALKANSTDVTSSLALKEDASNKSNAALGTSTTLFPTQSAVKTYVDAQIASATISDADAVTKGKLQLAGDLGGTAAAPTVPGLALKANTTDVTNSLALKAPLASPTFTGTVAGITKAMVNLANVDNTSDANKPVSTAAQTALNLKATLESPTFTGTPTAPTPISGDNSTKLATTAYVDAQVSAGAADASSTTKGIVQLTGDLGGSATSPTVPGLALKANTTDVTNSLALKAPLASPTFTGTVAGITKAMVDLANVDNTSDASKPVSTLTQTALDLKAPLASPTFTGTPSLPSGTTGVTQTAGDNSTKLATTAYVATAVSGGVSGVPYTGATGAVNLGSYDLTVNSLTFGRGNNGATYTYNTAIGYQSMESNVSGNYNTAIGYQTLKSNTDGGSNTAIGRQAMLSNLSGNVNTGVGTLALNKNIDGSYNAAFSNQALYNNTAGSYNTAIGTSSLEKNTSGNSNTAIGRVSLYKNTTGEKNTGIGFQAGGDNITGSSNTYLGYNSGLGITGGDNNTIIGANVTGLSSSLTDNIIIANGAGGGSSIKARHDGTSWTLGLIGSGTWSGTAIAVEKGGTGLTAAGTNGQVLTSTGSGTLTWTTPAGGVNLYQKTNNSTTLTSNVQNLISLSLPAGSYLVTYTGMAYAGTSAAEYVASRIAISDPGNLGGGDAIMVNDTVNDGRAYVVHQLAITLATAGSVSVWANNIYGTSDSYLINSRLIAVQVGSVIDQ